MWQSFFEAIRLFFRRCKQQTQTCYCHSVLHASYGKDAESSFRIFLYYAEVILFVEVSEVCSNKVLSELAFSNDNTVYNIVFWYSAHSDKLYRCHGNLVP